MHRIVALVITLALAISPVVALAQSIPAVSAGPTTFSASGSVTVNALNGQTSCLAYVEALGGGSVYLEASPDGTFAQASPGVPAVGPSGTIVAAASAITAAGYYFAPAPLGSFRARLVYSSGSPKVSVYCYAGGPPPVAPGSSASITSPIGQTTKAASVSVTQASDGPGTTAAAAAHTNVTVSGADIDPRVISSLPAITFAAPQHTIVDTLPSITIANTGFNVNNFPATQPVSCASGATCPVNATLQAGAAKIGYTGDTTNPDHATIGDGTTPSQKLAIDVEGKIGVTMAALPTPVAPRILTSASATSCTSLFSGSAALYFIENANAASQTGITVTLFDEGASPTCATANARGAYQLGQGQVITFGALGKGLSNGLAYTLSGALASGGPVILQASK